MRICFHNDYPVLLETSRSVPLEGVLTAQTTVDFPSDCDYDASCFSAGGTEYDCLWSQDGCKSMLTCYNFPDRYIYL